MKYWDDVKKIQVGDPVFLFNIETGTLFGPFTAASRPKTHLDPYAFLSSGRTYPAQVLVSWSRLNQVRDASRLSFFNEGLRCVLSDDETVEVLLLLSEAPYYRLEGWF